MEKVYLASYKSVHSGWNGIVNRLIQFMDKSIYSHCEICIGNPFETIAECYSSSGVDGGVRMKPMMLERSRWDVIELPDVTPDTVREFFKETDSEKYDYFGTGRFMLPMLLREHPTRWFCSEWAAKLCGYKDAWRFSPAALVALCLSRGMTFI